MLIAIDNRIIDTEDIYEITPIIGWNDWLSLSDTDINKADFISQNKELYDKFEFGIKLFNIKKVIYVTLPIKFKASTSRIDKSHWIITDMDEYKEYLTIIDNTEQKCKSIRDEIINYWNKSKFIIPKISTK